MSDPQNDSVESEVTEPVIENNDSIVDSETTEQVQAESKEQVDEDAKQAAIQKTINQKHFEAKQAERERDAANAKVAEFEEKERERQAQAVGNIPKAPDPFDDDYEAKQAVYVKAIQDKAVFDTNQNNFNQQQQFQQQQEMQAKQKQLQESFVSYSSKATELGINQDDLKAAGETVANYGLSDDLVMHILADSDGPLITKHLAANPQDGFELASLSPFAVGQFLDGIKQKASTLKPKTSNTVDPVETLQGNGVTPSDGYKNIKGAKFE